MEHSEIVRGDAASVRQNYRRFYLTRVKDLHWTDKWQEVAEEVHKEKRPYVTAQLLGKRHKSICELGCGTGDLLVRLRRAGFQGKLVGVDINIPPGLRKASKKYQIEIHKKDFLDFEGNYDAIIFFSALHFATLPGIPKITKNLRHCSNIYIVEAFVEHPENDILNEKLSELTGGRCYLYKEAELDNTFKEQGYRAIAKHTFLKELDPMERVFTFIHYVNAN